MAEKICRRCKEGKEVSTDNYPRNKASKDGFDSMCKKCWSITSKEKRLAKKGQGPKNTIGVKINPKSKKTTQKGVELVPPEVSKKIKKLERTAELPHDEVQFEYSGSLEESIKKYKERYGQEPEIIYIPARYFMRVPKGRGGSAKAPATSIKKKKVKRK